MNPWYILGWLLVLIIGVPTGIKFAAWAVDVSNAFTSYAQHWFAYRRTRDVEPEVGQWWSQWRGSSYEITNVWTRDQLRDEWSKQAWRKVDTSKLPATKRLGIRAGSASWGEDLEKWKVRVKSRKLAMYSTGRGTSRTVGGGG
jgi:hypothetical protein